MGSVGSSGRHAVLHRSNLRIPAAAEFYLVDIMKRSFSLKLKG